MVNKISSPIPTVEHPTIKQLVEWNKKGLRKLERLLQDNEEGGALFVDSDRQIIKALPVHFPWYVKVTKFRGNRYMSDEEFNNSPPEKRARPYCLGSQFLTETEVRILLGKDYGACEGYGDAVEYKEDGGTTTIEINAMLKAERDCPSRDANAYLLGLPFPESGILGFIVPVQYYRINQQRHKALGITKEMLNYLLRQRAKEEKELIRMMR